MEYHYIVFSWIEQRNNDSYNCSGPVVTSLYWAYAVLRHKQALDIAMKEHDN